MFITPAQYHCDYTIYLTEVSSSKTLNNEISKIPSSRKFHSLPSIPFKGKCHARFTDQIIGIQNIQIIL